VTTVAHEFAPSINVNGLEVQPGEIIVPTQENIRELHALGQLVIARYLDAQGNLAYLPASGRAAPIAPPKGSDSATIEAFHHEFAAWSEERKQPAVALPVPPAVGYPRATENDGYYLLDPFEGSTQTVLPYDGVGSALYRVQFAEIVE
jgi:hypothetical protein